MTELQDFVIKCLDLNGDGTILEHDLREVLQDLGVESAHLVKAADLTRDGKVAVAEFVNWLVTTDEQLPREKVATGNAALQLHVTEHLKAGRSKTVSMNSSDKLIDLYIKVVTEFHDGIRAGPPVRLFARTGHLNWKSAQTLAERGLTDGATVKLHIPSKMERMPLSDEIVLNVDYINPNGLRSRCQCYLRPSDTIRMLKSALFEGNSDLQVLASGDERAGMQATFQDVDINSFAEVENLLDCRIMHDATLVVRFAQTM